MFLLAHRNANEVLHSFIKWKERTRDQEQFRRVHECEKLFNLHFGFISALITVKCGKYVGGPGIDFNFDVENSFA